MTETTPNASGVGEGWVALTPELIHAGKSRAGGWNRKQLRAIGVEWSEARRRGWIRRVSGRKVSADAYREFLRLKGDAGKVGKLKPPKKPKNQSTSRVMSAGASRRQSIPQSGWHSLRFDGSCAGNGSDYATGRWAFHLVDGVGRTVGLRSGASAFRGVTNNVTEYEGLLNGLRHAAGVPGVRGLLIEGDSMLVVNQVAGRWKAKLPHLADLRDEALALLDELGVPWCARWIPREENAFCDAMT